MYFIAMISIRKLLVKCVKQHKMTNKNKYLVLIPLFLRLFEIL